jgi:putative methionine-R-sulfoxide reductase with GAF domain
MPVGDRAARMRAVVDKSWDALSSHGISWIGFYLKADGDALELASCRNKPACSPIGLHGACGRSFRSKRTLIVRDVRALGANYIACDPRDRSELVIPLLDEHGDCWGVLDVDSFEPAAFDQVDAVGFLDVLRAAGLTRDTTAPSTEVL